MFGLIKGFLEGIKKVSQPFLKHVPVASTKELLGQALPAATLSVASVANTSYQLGGAALEQMDEVWKQR